MDFDDFYKEIIRDHMRWETGPNQVGAIDLHQVGASTWCDMLEVRYVQKYVSLHQLDMHQVDCIKSIAPSRCAPSRYCKVDAWYAPSRLHQVVILRWETTPTDVKLMDISLKNY